MSEEGIFIAELKDSKRDSLFKLTTLKFSTYEFECPS